MVFWVKGEAVGMPCNQRAVFVEVVGEKIRVMLCGTEELKLIMPTDTCGIQFSREVTLGYAARSMV